MKPLILKWWRKKKSSYKSIRKQRASQKTMRKMMKCKQKDLWELIVKTIMLVAQNV